MNGANDLRFFVDKVTQLTTVEVEQNSDGATDVDSAFGSIAVHVVVQEPRSLVIDVHRPAPLIFTYKSTNIQQLEHYSPIKLHN